MMILEAERNDEEIDCDHDLGDYALPILFHLFLNEPSHNSTTGHP